MGSGKARPPARIAAALADLGRALELLPRPGMIIGGIAAIAHGVPRVTRDIDVAIDLHSVEIDLAAETLARHGFTARIPDAVAFARESGVLLMRHQRSAVEVDVIFTWLPFEVEAIERATRATILGAEVRLCRPEDLVIYKVLAWRAQDQQDVERLLAANRDLDLDRVRTIIADLASAIDAPQRVAELEALIARTRWET